MVPLASPRRVARWAALVFLVVAGCTNRQPPTPPPPADFLVTAGDSAFWVTTSDGRFRIRRAPLTLAHVGGRFYELYVADDDRSYFDALLIGQRIFRRDLVSGDSVQVFEDRQVARVARHYAAEHPSERRLDEDEDGSDDPHTVATSDAEILDVLGPLVSYAHHTDIDIANIEDSHVVRHGVIDLRDGSSATLTGIFGDRVASRIVAEGRAAYRVVIDSVRRSRSARGRRAARVIDAFRFDSTSFALIDIDGRPTVGFYVPGEGTSGGGLALPLPHVRAPEPAWWSEVASTVPKLGPDSSTEVWSSARYDVIARYDTSGEFATLIVRDSSRHEWNAGRLPTPTRRVYRLDVPEVDTAARRGLARAFDESTLYSGSARTVLGPRRDGTRLVLTGRRSLPITWSTAMARGRSFTGPDGTRWTVAIQSPGSSNAMVLFRHPDARTASLDRYAWYITSGSEAHDVTARLDKRAVLDSLGDTDVERLFRRSMPVSTNRSVGVAASR